MLTVQTVYRKTFVETKNMTQAEWLEVRRQGIGSSDCAAACGLNPYMSMLELWMIKTGRIQQNIEDESEGHAPLYWGKQLEPLLLNTTACIPTIKSVGSMQCYNILIQTSILCWLTWIIPWWG
jgi:predicted phage-related endonuclease